MPALVLRLPRAALARRDVVARLAADSIERSLFAFKCDELAFARALLRRRPNYWLYRTSQRAFAGDFVVVDLSEPRRTHRGVIAVELKRGERVRAVSTTSIQLANTKAVVRALADAGIVEPCATIDAVIGDADGILDALATPRRRRPPRRASGP